MVWNGKEVFDEACALETPWGDVDAASGVESQGTPSLVLSPLGFP